MANTVRLAARVFLNFDIELLSGLHIGGSDEGISIGGLDKTVIRDTLTNRPYIPGSSLRGKVRSLTEKYLGAEQNTNIGGANIHSAGSRSEYARSQICQVYGIPAAEFPAPGRLIVRDVVLDDVQAQELSDLKTDLPFTEVKTEVAIDRLTSAANPRQMERVPAGAVFRDAEIVYSLYDVTEVDDRSDAEKRDKPREPLINTTHQDDLDNFELLLTGLQLLEDDYLGGLGSRGSGKIKLTNIKVRLKTGRTYRTPITLNKEEAKPYATLDELVTDLAHIKTEISRALNSQEHV